MTLEKESPPTLEARQGTEDHTRQSEGTGDSAEHGGCRQSDNAAPNTEAALEFLRLVYPAGPWVLTAIRTDKKGIETRTFTPEQAPQAHAWIEHHNGERNIYWSVNPPLQAVKKKAEREDIKEICYLHVDIDPRAGEPLNAEHARLAELVSSKLPRDVPPPTFTIFSGGGYQAFWKLDRPIPINGELAAAEEAKRYNQQLELMFGGDNCHNVDRIMRLPGTINVPDERKLKKGRKPMLARLEDWHGERVYPASAFTKAATVQLAGDSGATVAPSITANIRRVPDLEELSEWNVPARIRIIINWGRDPDNPKKGDNSRSQWLFDALCGLVRCDVPDEVIFSLITDPDYGISESVLEKGSNAEKYALRQIARAKEHAIDPALCELNDKHFVVGNDGSRCRVMQELHDPVYGRPRLTRQSFDDFRNRYMNRKVQAGLDENGKPKFKPLGHWWLAHPKRRQFETIVFVPGQTVESAYNLWRGYGFDGIPGDKHESFLQHVRENVCQGNEDHYGYLLGWMARAVQKPGEQGHVAVVLRGRKGVGKGFVAKHFGKLFGRHFLHVSNPQHLIGNFNAHLRDTCVLFADEAFVPKDKKHDSILKTLVTEDMLLIEGKGIDAVQSANFLHIIMATNEDYAVVASGDERRYFVLDVGTGNQQDTEFFGRIQTDLESGGYENLLHFLLSYDLSAFNVRKVPETGALREQKDYGRPRWLNTIIEMAENGVSPDHDGWKRGKPYRVSVSGILEAAGLDAGERPLQMAVAKALQPFLRMDSEGAISLNVDAKCLCEEGRAPIPIEQAAQYPHERRIHRKQRRMYELRELVQVRALLDAAGLHGDWDKAVTAWKPRGDEMGAATLPGA